jgi:hypothetical protein
MVNIGTSLIELPVFMETLPVIPDSSRLQRAGTDIIARVLAEAIRAAQYPLRGIAVQNR